MMAPRPRVLRQKSFVTPVVRNPFSHRLHLNSFDKIRIVLMSLSIAPIRLLLVILILPIAWICAVIAMAGVDHSLHQPLSGWRRSMRPVLIFLGRAIFFVLGFHYVRFKGQKALPSEATIFCVAPHTGFFDVIVAIMLGLPSSVSREDNGQTPVIGTIIDFLQPVYVSRHDQNSRIKTIEEIKRRSQPGSGWPQIMIFPEGTTTNTSCLITFKGGAFYPGVPVQPVILKFDSETVIWTWEGLSAPASLWLTVCNFHNGMELEFLPVYTPSKEEIADSKLFSRNVRAEMAKCHIGTCEVTCLYKSAQNIGGTCFSDLQAYVGTIQIGQDMQCDQSDDAVPGAAAAGHSCDRPLDEDCKLMMDAEKKGLPTEIGLVEFQKMLNKLGVKRETLSERLENYADIAKSEGYIGVEDFAKYLNMPVTENLREIFDMYDRNGSGRIDFREYVIGCSLVAQPANNEETIQLAFKMFGGEKGHLVHDDLVQLLRGSVGMTSEECEVLFNQVDHEGTGKITYEQFQAYAKKKPEYARLFTSYLEKADVAMETVIEETEEGEEAKKEAERPSSARKRTREMVTPSIT